MEAMAPLAPAARRIPMGDTAADYLCGRLSAWGIDTIYGFVGDVSHGIPRRTTTARSAE